MPEFHHVKGFSQVATYVTVRVSVSNAQWFSLLHATCVILFRSIIIVNKNEVILLHGSTASSKTTRIAGFLLRSEHGSIRQMSS